MIIDLFFESKNHPLRTATRGKGKIHSDSLWISYPFSLCF